MSGFAAVVPTRPANSVLGGFGTSSAPAYSRPKNKPFRLINLPFYYVGQLDRVLKHIEMIPVENEYNSEQIK